ncbi:MAG: hypothetical protein U0793_00895 [Gemmataceae bacterium]
MIITALAGFVAAQLVLRAVIELWRPDWRDPTFEAKLDRLKRGVAAEPKALTIVFLGSSQTVFGVHGRDIGAELSRRFGRPVRAFNFGAYAAGPFTCLVYLNRLLERGIRPDLIVVEAQPRHVYEQTVPSDIRLFPPEALALRDIGLVKRYGGAKTVDYRRDWWKCFVEPAFAHRVSFLSLACPGLLSPAGLIETWSDCDETGWKPFPEIGLNAAQKRHILDEARAAHEPSLRCVGDGSPLASALLELLGRCRQEKIPTALLVLPEGPLFRSLYRPGGIERFRQDLRGAAACLKTPVVDLWDLCDEDEFHDSFHLLEHGAQRASAALAERLVRTELRGLFVPK